MGLSGLLVVYAAFQREGNTEGGKVTCQWHCVPFVCKDVLMKVASRLWLAVQSASCLAA